MKFGLKAFKIFIGGSKEQQLRLAQLLLVLMTHGSKIISLPVQYYVNLKFHIKRMGAFSQAILDALAEILPHYHF